MILDRLLGRKQLSTPADTDPIWYGESSHSPSAGVKVNETTAMTYSAVWCATRILSETIASLPAVLFRRYARGQKERAEYSPLFKIFHDSPNEDMDSFTFWEMMSCWLVNAGNAYAEKQIDGAGQVIGLWPIHPSRVSIPRREKNDPLVYQVRSDNEPESYIPSDLMFHIVGPLSDDGLTGKGVIAQARESIGMGLATEQYGAGFFGNGATPGGVITIPDLLDDGAARRMRHDWKQIHSNRHNPHNIAILEQGSTYTKIGVPPEDAQFLQTREHNITEIARWYRVPPHMLGDLSRATFSNIEQQSLDFVKSSVVSWLRRIECAANRQLIDSDSEFLKFVVEGLLRGDSVGRSAFYVSMINTGVFSINEVREKEDMNPIDGGDTRLIPMNMNAVNEPEGSSAGNEPDPLRESTNPIDPFDIERVREHLRKGLEQTISRMLTKERNAATRAAKNPREFLTWLDAFYEKHLGTFADAVAFQIDACNAVGTNLSTEKFSRDHCEASRLSLLDSSECQSSELEDSVALCVDSWTGRAATEAASVFADLDKECETKTNKTTTRQGADNAG